MYFSLDILSHIFKYLEDCEIFRFCQTNKYTMNLRRKEKLWSLVWKDRYPHNDLIEGLDMYQNFKRLTLVKKFIELTNKSFNKEARDPNTVKRDPERAMFIPMCGYKGKNANKIIFPESLKYTFGSVNVILPTTPIKWNAGAILFANWLYETNNLFLKPKKGDILAFEELDPVENLYIFNGKEITACWSSFDVPYPHLFDMHWPDISLNYYGGQVLVPKRVKEELQKNITYKKIPIRINQSVLTQVYSFCEIKGRKFYAFFDIEFADLGNYPFDAIWNWNTIKNYNLQFGYNHYMLTGIRCEKDIEYIIFGEPPGY